MDSKDVHTTLRFSVWVGKKNPNTHGSSTLIDAFNLVHKFDTTLETKPINAPAGAPTKPAAGVMATRPAIAPVQNPTTDHLRSSR